MVIHGQWRLDSHLDSHIVPRADMFELYVWCPAAGEPVYAGFQTWEGPVPDTLAHGCRCPKCGESHARVWSAIPVTPLAPDIMPEGAPVPEWAVSEAAAEVVWPQVA
jgi:hypothetical protein